MDKIKHLKPDHDFLNPERDTPVSLAQLKATPLMGDNKGAIYSSNNPISTSGVKHLDNRYFRIRDYVKWGILKIMYIGTVLNIADFFTKPLQGPRFHTFSSYLMGV